MVNILNNILYYLMCIYIILLPILPNEITLHGRNISPADVILGFIIIFYILKLLLNKESKERFILGIRDFFTNYLSIFMTILALMMFVSISYAVEKKLALSESLRFVSYIIIYFIIKYDINYKRYTKGMIKSYMVTTLILSVFGIYQYFTGFDLSNKFKNYGYARFKIAATMDNPNNLGAFLILAIFPLIMLCIYEKRKIRRTVYALLSLLILIDMVLTGSRNAIVGVTVGLIVLAILYSFRLLILIGGLGVISLFVPEIKDRVMAITSKTQNQSRIYLWEIAKKMIKDHPLFGVGNGNYVSLYDKYTAMYPQYKFYGYTRFPCHNSYLKVESELGIIGGVSFIGILIAALIKVKDSIFMTSDKFYKSFYTGFLASMIAFYVMNLVDNLFFVPKTTTYFWILLAISQAIIFKTDTEF